MLGEPGKVRSADTRPGQLSGAARGWKHGMGGTTGQISSVVRGVQSHLVLPYSIHFKHTFYPEHVPSVLCV